MIIQHHHWRMHPAAPRGCVDDQVRWNERPKVLEDDSKQSQDPMCLQGLRQSRFDCKKKKSYEPSANVIDVAFLEHVQASAQESDCKLLRFCCKEHLRRCQPIDSEKRGPRECMTPPQVALLVDILLKSSAPWAVPLMLLQKMTGERCGCMTRARVRWPDLVSCRLTIEKVTGKTQERSIALTPWLRDIIEYWLLERPLVGADGGDGIPTQWPFTNPRMKMLVSSLVKCKGFRRGGVSTLVHTHHHVEGTLKESGKQVR